MENVKNFYEKSYGTATPLEDDLYQYGDMPDFEGIDAGYPDSIYQDKRSKNDSVAPFQDQGDSMNFDDQGDEFGGGVAGNDSQSLKKELQDFETTSIRKNPNLSAEEKKDYQTKIEKWIHSVDLTPGAMDQIQAEFQTLQQEISTAGAYPTSVRNLSKATGVDPSELESLFKKYGISGDKLPSPSDDKMAALLNDEVFADTLGSLNQGVAGAAKALEEEITQQTKTATELNDEAKKNNKIERSSDDSSYKFLYDAHFHQDDKSKALIEAHKQLTAEKTRVLTAIYGKKINVDEAFDLPEVELVPFEVDLQGAGKTNIPDWMKQAHYPMQSYDRWEYKWEDFALNFLLPVGQGIAWIEQADDLGKRSDLPEGGELINIGVQSSGGDVSSIGNSSDNTQQNNPKTTDNKKS